MVHLQTNTDEKQKVTLCVTK